MSGQKEFVCIITRGSADQSEGSISLTDQSVSSASANSKSDPDHEDNSTCVCPDLDLEREKEREREVTAVCATLAGCQARCLRLVV